MKRFHKFCTVYNVIDPFPLTEHTLCFFVSYLAEQGLAPQTGKAYLAALRNAQISLGLQGSVLPSLPQAGISRTRLQRGNASPRVRLPVKAHTLRRIRGVLFASADRDRFVLWSVACTAFSI